jgi:hypothetical protein
MRGSMRKLGRLLAAFLISSSLLTTCAIAQTPLTEIRDTVANADGTLFDGTVVITWNGNSGPNGGTVSPLSTWTNIDNGALTVLLVPSTTATKASYQSVFNSNDGTALWTETWAVPPSTTALTLSQVRVATSQGGGTSGSGASNGNNNGNDYATLPISISEITNLSTYLNTINSSLTSLTVQVNNLSSVVNSGGSLTGLQNQINVLTTAITNMSSTIAGVNSTVSGLQTTVSGLTSTVGTLSTTVAGQQTSMSGLNTQVTSLSNSVTGLTNTVNALTATNTVSVAFIDAETPGGLLNGINGSFVLSQIPSPTGSLMLYRNGLIQASGVDFNCTGQNITFTATSIPKTGDILQAFYRVIGSTKSITFSDSETPAGTINGTNLAFTLAASPSPSNSLKLFKNGVLLQQGGDYAVSGSTITFMNTAVAPQAGDQLTADYRH